MVDVKQVFQAEDGTIFGTRAEVIDYARRPKITDALMAFTNKNQAVVDWLVANQEKVEDAFDTGTIKRVKGSEKAKLGKVLDLVAEAHKNDPKFAFLTDNKDAVLESFRWPSVKRLKPEEKTAEAIASLTTLANGNVELANYVATNEVAIRACYEAGVEKRAVNPKASEALAAYQAKKKAEKLAKEDAAAQAAAAKENTPAAGAQ
jgi:hypothetical protein